MGEEKPDGCVASFKGGFVIAIEDRGGWREPNLGYPDPRQPSDSLKPSPTAPGIDPLDGLTKPDLVKSRK